MFSSVKAAWWNLRFFWLFVSSDTKICCVHTDFWGGHSKCTNLTKFGILGQLLIKNLYSLDMLLFCVFLKVMYCGYASVCWIVYICVDVIECHCVYLSWRVNSRNVEANELRLCSLRTSFKTEFLVICSSEGPLIGQADRWTVGGGWRVETDDESHEVGVHDVYLRPLLVCTTLMMWSA